MISPVKESSLRSTPVRSIETTIQTNNHLSYANRYELRQDLRAYSTRGLIGCGIVGDDTLLELKAYQSETRVKVGRMNPCKRHYCPVCSQHIASERQVLDQRRVEAYIESTPEKERETLRFFFLTGTLGHSKKDRLEDLIRTLSKTFFRVLSDTKRKAKRDGQGEVEFLRALDYTYNEKNGHHPHIHSLIITRGIVDKNYLSELISYARERWIKLVKLSGYTINKAKGIVILETKKESLETLTKYLNKGSKLVQELVKTGNTQARYSWTGSLTFEDIWGKVVSGSPKWKRVWNEIEEAFHNKKVFSASKGLSDLTINEEQPEPEDKLETIELITGKVSKELEQKKLMVPLIKLYGSFIEGENLDLYDPVVRNLRATRFYQRNRAEKLWLQSFLALVSALQLYQMRV